MCQGSIDSQGRGSSYLCQISLCIDIVSVQSKKNKQTNSGLFDCSDKYSQQLVSLRRASVSWTPRDLLECVTVSPKAGNFTEERSK